jgi:hypothetical protein
MLIVGLPDSEQALSSTRSGGTPYGASHFTPYGKTVAPTEEEKSLARAHGARGRRGRPRPQGSPRISRTNGTGEAALRAQRRDIDVIQQSAERTHVPSGIRRSRYRAASSGQLEAPPRRAKPTPRRSRSRRAAATGLRPRPLAEARADVGQAPSERRRRCPCGGDHPPAPLFHAPVGRKQRTLRCDRTDHWHPDRPGQARHHRRRQ